MRPRVFGAIVVVVIALIPTLAGGPVFAAFMTALGIAGYREYVALAARITAVAAARAAIPGMGVIIALGAAPLLDRSGILLLALSFLALTLPLVSLFPVAEMPGAFAGWSSLSSGSLYLGLPVYAAVFLRSIPGETRSPSIDTVAAQWSAISQSAPRGLAWTVIVILAIWSGDTVAYLGGRLFGRRKLAPKLSPGKTIEGGIAGLIGAMLIVAVAFPLVGLGGWMPGLLTGAALGLAGQVGDLAESFLKRQSGVKDTGTLIPGHGGVLDRIDALLFAFPVGLILATGYEQLGV